MQDASLTTSKYLPAAGANNTTGYIALPVNATPRSNSWRLGRIRVVIPALATHTDATKTVTLTMQDSLDGVTFATTKPQITVNIPGVAISGSAAMSLDLPLPPNQRGYINFLQTVPAGDAAMTGAQITYTWCFE